MEKEKTGEKKLDERLNRAERYTEEKQANKDKMKHKMRLTSAFSNVQKNQ